MAVNTHPSGTLAAILSLTCVSYQVMFQVPYGSTSSGASYAGFEHIIEPLVS